VTALAARMALLVMALAAALPPAPASAAPLGALPPTIRVNVAGLGTVSARIASTGTIRVTGPDGAVFYRGSATTAARLGVYRLGEERPRPPDADVRPRSRAEWIERRQWILGGGMPLVVASRPTVLVPFELAAIVKPLVDPIGDPLIRSDRIVAPIHYEAESGLLSYNGRIFRGRLELQLDDAGDMIVVNEVSTRDYLASVVGSEIPVNWHAEAQAAQAIAARTYLFTHLGRRSAYDIEGDVRDQAYEGFGRETTATLRAVDRTKGIIATYRGRPIEALYSANTGGVTEDSENVWGNRIAYLRSVPSPWDEAANNSSWGKTSWEWKKELTPAQLGAFLRQRGINVGLPDRVELRQVASSGRVLQAAVVGDRGTRTIGRDSSRYYFGLRSSLFTVDKVAGGDTEGVHYLDTARIRTLEELGAERVAIGYKIERGEDRAIYSVEVNSYIYELPGRFVFRGRGFGHGIGMSQWGMQGMAMAGKSAEEILKHYYVGIELTDIGGD